MILTAIVFVPMIAALAVLLLPKSAHLQMKWAALIGTLVQGLLVVLLLFNYNGNLVGVNNLGSYQFVENVSWIQIQTGPYGILDISYTLGVDGLSISMLILTALIAIIGVISSWSITEKIKGYLFSYLVLVTAMTGVFVALDFFLFYIFWELMLIPMYFLIGIWGGKRREYAAIKFFLYTFIGSLFMLLVIILLYFSYVSNPEAAIQDQIHSFNMLTMMDSGNLIAGSLMATDSWRHIAFILMFIGFAVKIPIVPFHTWLPDAHVEAPTPISVILAGVLLKMGTYGLMRVAYPIFPDMALYYSYAIGVIGVINIIYGALTAMGQTDFKRLIAYSSISHMGFVLLGMASLTTEGMTGAILQMFSHGLISAMLFLVVGVLYDRAHHREINGFGGIGGVMPYYTGVTLFAFMASLGLPALSGFVAEALIFMGGFTSQLTRTLTIIAIFGMLITAVYYLWTYQRVFTGEVNEKYSGLSDLTSREVLMFVPLIIGIVWMGIYPSVLTDLMTSSINYLTDMVKYSGNLVDGLTLGN